MCRNVAQMDLTHTRPAANRTATKLCVGRPAFMSVCVRYIRQHVIIPSPTRRLIRIHTVSRSRRRLLRWPNRFIITSLAIANRLGGRYGPCFTGDEAPRPRRIVPRSLPNCQVGGYRAVTAWAAAYRRYDGHAADWVMTWGQPPPAGRAPIEEDIVIDGDARTWAVCRSDTHS